MSCLVFERLVEVNVPSLVFMLTQIITLQQQFGCLAILYKIRGGTCLFRRIVRPYGLSLNLRTLRSFKPGRQTPVSRSDMVNVYTRGVVVQFLGRCYRGSFSTGNRQGTGETTHLILTCMVPPFGESPSSNPFYGVRPSVRRLHLNPVNPSFKVSDLSRVIVGRSDSFPLWSLFLPTPGNFISRVSYLGRVVPNSPCNHFQNLSTI